MIKEILYKLFKIEEKPCEACEVLKMQIGIINNEKERLLQQLLTLTQPRVEPAPIVVQPQELKRRTIPWNVQRQMLEAEDRKRAEIMAQREQADKIAADIARLEKEVGVADAEAIEGSTGSEIQSQSHAS